MREIEYRVDVDVKRLPISAPADKLQEHEDEQLQSAIDLWGKRLAIYIEDKLNGKSVDRLPPAFESPYQKEL